ARRSKCASVKCQILSSPKITRNSAKLAGVDATGSAFSVRGNEQRGLGSARRRRDEVCRFAKEPSKEPAARLPYRAAAQRQSIARQRAVGEPTRGVLRTPS